MQAIKDGERYDHRDFFIRWRSIYGDCITSGADLWKAAQTSSEEVPISIGVGAPRMREQAGDIKSNLNKPIKEVY